MNDGTWKYTWNAGRQLKQMSKSGTTVQFKYDHNGLRVGKVVNGTETKYQLHGKLLTHMTVDNDNLHFFYDAQSRPAKVSYNGIIYTYVHNLQGDIVGLLDSAGTLVVEYKYDAWGKLLSTTGSLSDTLGKRNPFRYRGYIYDEETGLYYLRNRYYSCVWVRFLVADEICPEQNNDIFDHNAYAYVGACPTNRKDSDGFFWHIAIGAVVGGLVSAIGSAASQLIENKGDFTKIDVGEVVVAGVAGAASGALAATGVGIVGQIVGNALISGAENIANQTILDEDNEPFDFGSLALDMAIGGIGGAIGGDGALVRKTTKGTTRMTSHITSLTRRTNSRVVKGIASGSATTVKKAVKYYVTNTRVLYRQLSSGLAKGLGVGSAYRLTTAVMTLV